MLKTVLPAIGALTLIACGSSAEIRHDETEALSSPQIATASTVSSIGYSRLKAAAEEEVALIATRGDQPLYDSWMSGQEGVFDFFNCEILSDTTIDPGTADDPHLAFLAIYVANAAAGLRRAGYPQEVYRDALLRFETRMLQHLASAPAPIEEGRDTTPAEDAAHQLFQDGTEELIRVAAVEMEAERRAKYPQLPRIDADGGCGGGEVEVIVRADPPTGSVWLLRAFAFNSCRRRVSDPWNVEACGWRRADPETPLALSGRYYYQAVWPGGRTTRSDRDFTALTGNGEGPFLSVVRP